jgi:hypothetical protein
MVLRAYHPAENNLELVVTIVRGADAPRLDKYDLDRILRAAKVYKAYQRKNPTPLGKATMDNPNVRLILDLQHYLRLASKERDAAQIRSMLSEEQVTDALEVVISPFMELIKKAQKAGVASAVLNDFEHFMNQLIVIIDALRARIQDPQKAVRIISRLLAKYQSTWYSHIHQIHNQDTVVEEFFQWCWTAAIFVRRGMSETLDVDAIFPTNGEDKQFLIDEIEELSDYQKKKRTRDYEVMCK